MPEVGIPEMGGAWQDRRAVVLEHVRAPVLQESWGDLMVQLRSRAGAPRPTTDEPVEAWMDAIKATPRWTGATSWERVGIVCTRGVSVADLALFADASYGGQVKPVAAFLHLMQASLKDVISVAPHCPVNEALGWLLVFEADLDATDGQLGGGARLLQWLDAGFTYEDHVYAASGLSVIEAAALARTGGLPSHNEARVLAALRGALTPHG